MLVTSFVLLHTVHTCLLLRNFQQNICSAQPGQHSHMQASCCPGCALQLLYVYTPHCFRLGLGDFGGGSFTGLFQDGAGGGGGNQDYSGGPGRGTNSSLTG